MDIKEDEGEKEKFNEWLLLEELELNEFDCGKSDDV